MPRILRKPAAFLAALLFIGANAPVRLQTEIDALSNDPALKHGLWGFCVLTADSGQVIASYDADRSLMPASTMKILTTGAALGLLGPDFRYETKIEYDGAFDSITGVIHGNLYIRGAGDPTLDSKYFTSKDSVSAFDSIPSWLQQKGVKKIEGEIIGDASCFSENPLPDGWQWGDLGQYYGAGTCGLAYHDNTVTLHFNSTYKDSCALVRVFPRPFDVTYTSFVKPGGSKDEAYVYGAPYGKEYFIYGTIPAQRKDYEVDAANPDPALQCAMDLRAALHKSGIEVTGYGTTLRRFRKRAGYQDPGLRRELVSVFSPKLSKIVEQTNVHSDNTYAEQLARTLGLLNGESGTTEAGIAVIKNYWQSLGIDLDGLNMTDGSGLSRSNLVTTAIEANILQQITKQRWYKDFDRSLPVAGKNGSMAGLCKGTCAENNLHAKTGYINRARGYAGYVKTKSGKLLCFSLLANNYTCTPTEMKKKLEKLLVAMAELP